MQHTFNITLTRTLSYTKSLIYMTCFRHLLFHLLAILKLLHAIHLKAGYYVLTF